jgi:hypothetical protein
MQRVVMERHHPAGRTVDPAWVVPLCRTCHAIATAYQWDLPAEIRHPRTRRDRQVALLHGVADALRLIEQGARAARVRMERLIAEVEQEGTP